MSILGHPLLTISLLSGYVGFLRLPQKSAVIICGLLLAIVIIPVVWHNYQKVNNGKYTNFDVSSRSQRSGFYPVLIGLTLLFLALLAVTGQPYVFIHGTMCMLLLLVSSYCINFYIKTSLHTSISIFIAVGFYSLNHSLGLILGIFTILVALSRLVLNRHTISEILVGALMGVISGICLYML